MGQTKVGVSIIIFNVDGKVLVGKRKGSHGAGLLQVPGGHIEFLETYVQTCDRELLEEIGTDLYEESFYTVDDTDIDKYRPIGFSEDFFERKMTVTRHHYTTLYFGIRVMNDTVITNCEPDKCEGWEWMDIKDLPVDGMFCDCYRQIIDAHIKCWHL